MSFCNISYPERLIAEMWHFALWEAKTPMKASDVSKALAVFFTEDQLAKAKESILKQYSLTASKKQKETTPKRRKSK